MQEVITKTIIILAALVAIVLVFNRLGRSQKLNGGCGCGRGTDASSSCKECAQASGCDTREETSSAKTPDKSTSQSSEKD